MKKILIFFTFIISFLNASTQQLTVSILPQKYFVEKIVKDKFEINVMVKPGSSPHTYEPKSSQMKALANSKIYFYAGVSFEEAWLDKFKQSAKNTLFIDTTTGIEKIEMEEHEHHEESSKTDANKDKHKHHDEEKHDHSGLDPHVWLDPTLVKTQAKNIYEAVLKVDSVNSEFYKANYEAFIKELEVLDKEIETILNPYKEKAFMVFHPSWGYFAARYDIEQISIEIEGKEPKPNELLQLVEEAKKHNIKIVFVAPQFSQKSAKTISQNVGANVVSINPLSDDWYNNMLFVANEIAKSYK